MQTPPAYLVSDTSLGFSISVCSSYTTLHIASMLNWQKINYIVNKVES